MFWFEHENLKIKTSLICLKKKTNKHCSKSLMACYLLQKGVWDQGQIINKLQGQTINILQGEITNKLQQTLIIYDSCFPITLNEPHHQKYNDNTLMFLVSYGSIKTFLAPDNSDLYSAFGK